MLKLEGVNISFDKIIIENSDIEIPRGNIVSITGDSGTGKTSLLYLFGLISTNKKYKYIYNDQAIDLNDDELTSNLRRNNIGFLFQDNSLIENLTILENVRLSANLAGHEITESEIQDYLKSVDLKVTKKTYPKQLSGGELQRAAIACIMAKRTEIILADEPTSALDKINETAIINIFKKLAQGGVTIIISTHNSDICSESNMVYSIENKKVVLIKDKRVSKQPNTEKRDSSNPCRFGIKKLFNYIRRTSKKERNLKMVIIIFCAIAISGFSVARELAEGLKETQQSLLNQISDREIFLINMTSSQTDFRDSDENISISQEEYKKIQSINTIGEIYPYYEFRSFCLNPQYRNLGTEVTVTSEMDSRTFDFSLENEPQTNLIVIPYNKNSDLDKQLLKTYKAEEGGVYLSYSLAAYLELLESDNTEVNLNFEIGIPVKNYIDTFFDENDNSVKMDLDLLEFEEMDIDISGILNPGVFNRYSIVGENIIYMPHEIMDSLLKNKIDNTFVDYALSDFELSEWLPSAYLIYANTYNDLEGIQKKLQNINSNFIARSDYQDTKKMDDMINDVNNITTLVVGILLLILFVLMSAIFISSTLNRKREIALLKVNGMTSKKLILLMIMESCIQSLKIILISVSVSFLLIVAMNYFLFGGAMTKFGPPVILHTTFISLLFVLVPTIVSVSFTINVNPDRILRN